METAVCLSGQLRTLLTPAVQDSMISMVHQPANEYFISTEKWLDQHDPRLRISPVIAVYADTAGEDLHPDRTNGSKHGLKACRNHTMTHPYLFPQAVRWVACQRLLIREEQARRMQYTHVLRIRTDIRFVSPLPPAPEALALAGRDILLFDDMIALSAREHADALLLNPLLFYRACHGDVEWTRACGRPVDPGELSGTIWPPCSPMNLIATYDARVLTIRQCGFPWDARCGFQGSMSAQQVRS